MGQTRDDAEDLERRRTKDPFNGETPLPPGSGETVPKTTEPHAGGRPRSARPEGRGRSPRRRDAKVTPEGSTVLSGSSSDERTPSGPPEEGRVWLDKYDVVRKLGQGAMGEVWLVRHLGLGVERALKLISLTGQYNPELRARFKREARAMALFEHPNAVAVHDASTARDIAYIEMDYVVGRSLDKVLQRGVPMPLDWTGRLVAQLCDVLQEAHRMGIVHRDIKPSNLMLVDGKPEGRDLKVLDFGIAKLLGAKNQEGDELKTSQGVTIGTLAYMSPEQVKGDSEKIDGRSDLYAVGIVLYELLTGHRPFTKPGFLLQMDHLSTPPPPFAESNPQVRVPPEVEALVLRCLAKDPALRPQSAQELADAFRLAVAPPKPKPRLDWQAPPPPTRRFFVLASLAAVSGVGGLVAWLLLPKPPPVILQHIHAGKEINVPIPTGRGKSTAIAKVIPGKMPAGITVERVGEGQSRDVASFRVKADLNVDLSPEKRQLTFEVRVGKRRETQVVELTLLPPEVASLPDEFTPMPGSRLQPVGEKVYPDRIARSFPDGVQAVFLLVKKGRGGGPNTFYIMQDKVTIGLYKKFAAESPEFIKAAPPAADDQLPVMGVDVQEAYEFARWIRGKGGEAGDEGRIEANLPTTEQWDKAAGRYDPQGRDGPFEGPWGRKKGQIAVLRELKEGPMPVGTATLDRSWCGCRDMAGNGLEWTRNAVEAGKTVPLSPDDYLKSIPILLRGNPFTADKPLRFDVLEENNIGALYCNAHDSMVSFRVVFDLDPR